MVKSRFERVQGVPRHFVATPLLFALLLTGLADVTGTIDCAQAFEQRNDLARAEAELHRLEVDRGPLTQAEWARLDAVRKRRRQLLVCG